MAGLAYSTARLSHAHTAAPGAVKQQQTASQPGQLLELAHDGGGGGGASGGRAHASTLLYIPCTYKPGVPAPLVLTLHGAGGDAHGGHRCVDVGDKACTGMLGGGPVSAGAHVGAPSCCRTVRMLCRWHSMRFPCSPGGLHHLIEHADEYGAILMSPTSRSSTWDMLRGGYGPGKLAGQAGSRSSIAEVCSLPCWLPVQPVMS